MNANETYEGLHDLSKNLRANLEAGYPTEEPQLSITKKEAKGALDDMGLSFSEIDEAQGFQELRQLINQELARVTIPIKFLLKGLGEKARRGIKDDFCSEGGEIKKQIQCTCNKSELEVQSVGSDPLETEISMILKCASCGRQVNVKHSTIPR